MPDTLTITGRADDLAILRRWADRMGVAVDDEEAAFEKGTTPMPTQRPNPKMIAALRAANPLLAEAAFGKPSRRPLSATARALLQAGDDVGRQALAERDAEEASFAKAKKPPRPKWSRYVLEALQANPYGKEILDQYEDEAEEPATHAAAHPRGTPAAAGKVENRVINSDGRPASRAKAGTRLHDDAHPRGRKFPGG